jgi:hypothetical protein
LAGCFACDWTSVGLLLHEQCSNYSCRDAMLAVNSLLGQIHAHLDVLCSPKSDADKQQWTATADTAEEQQLPPPAAQLLAGITAMHTVKSQQQQQQQQQQQVVLIDQREEQPVVLKPLQYAQGHEEQLELQETQEQQHHEEESPYSSEISLRSSFPGPCRTNPSSFTETGAAAVSAAAAAEGLQQRLAARLDAAAAAAADNIEAARSKAQQHCSQEQVSVDKLTASPCSLAGSADFREQQMQQLVSCDELTSPAAVDSAAGDTEAYERGPVSVAIAAAAAAAAAVGHHCSELHDNACRHDQAAATVQDAGRAGQVHCLPAASKPAAELDSEQQDADTEEQEDQEQPQLQPSSVPGEQLNRQVQQPCSWEAGVGADPAIEEEVTAGCIHGSNSNSSHRSQDGQQLSSAQALDQKNAWLTDNLTQEHLQQQQQQQQQQYRRRWQLQAAAAPDADPHNPQDALMQLQQQQKREEAQRQQQLLQRQHWQEDTQRQWLQLQRQWRQLQQLQQRSLDHAAEEQSHYSCVQGSNHAPDTCMAGPTIKQQQVLVHQEESYKEQQQQLVHERRMLQEAPDTHDDLHTHYSSSKQQQQQGQQQQQDRPALWRRSTTAQEEAAHQLHSTQKQVDHCALQHASTENAEYPQQVQQQPELEQQSEEQHEAQWSLYTAPWAVDSQLSSQLSSQLFSRQGSHASEALLLLDADANLEQQQQVEDNSASITAATAAAATVPVQSRQSTGAVGVAADAVGCHAELAEKQQQQQDAEFAAAAATGCGDLPGQPSLADSCDTWIASSCNSCWDIAQQQQHQQQHEHQQQLLQGQLEAPGGHAQHEQAQQQDQTQQQQQQDLCTEVSEQLPMPDIFEQLSNTMAELCYTIASPVKALTAAQTAGHDATNAAEVQGAAAVAAAARTSEDVDQAACGAPLAVTAPQDTAVGTEAVAAAAASAAAAVSYAMPVCPNAAAAAAVAAAPWLLESCWGSTGGSEPGFQGSASCNGIQQQESLRGPAAATAGPSRMALAARQLLRRRAPRLSVDWQCRSADGDITAGVRNGTATAAAAAAAGEHGVSSDWAAGDGDAATPSAAAAAGGWVDAHDVGCLRAAIVLGVGNQSLPDMTSAASAATAKPAAASSADLQQQLRMPRQQHIKLQEEAPCCQLPEGQQGQQQLDNEPAQPLPETVDMSAQEPKQQQQQLLLLQLAAAKAASGSSSAGDHCSSSTAAGVRSAGDGGCTGSSSSSSRSLVQAAAAGLRKTPVKQQLQPPVLCASPQLRARAAAAAARAATGSEACGAAGAVNSNMAATEVAAAAAHAAGTQIELLQSSTASRQQGRLGSRSCNRSRMPNLWSQRHEIGQPIAHESLEAAAACGGGCVAGSAGSTRLQQLKALQDKRLQQRQQQWQQQQRVCSAVAGAGAAGHAGCALEPSQPKSEQLPPASNYRAASSGRGGVNSCIIMRSAEAAVGSRSSWSERWQQQQRQLGHDCDAKQQPVASSSKAAKSGKLRPKGSSGYRPQQQQSQQYSTGLSTSSASTPNGCNSSSSSSGVTLTGGGTLSGLRSSASSSRCPGRVSSSVAFGRGWSAGHQRHQTPKQQQRVLDTRVRTSQQRSSRKEPFQASSKNSSNDGSSSSDDDGGDIGSVSSSIAESIRASWAQGKWRNSPGLLDRARKLGLAQQHASHHVQQQQGKAACSRRLLLVPFSPSRSSADAGRMRLASSSSSSSGSDDGNNC